MTVNSISIRLKKCDPIDENCHAKKILIMIVSFL